VQKRDEVFDVAKGVGIVAVVALHLSSRSASLFHKPYDGGWWTLKWLNLFVNFCVPLFLLISAILMARSAGRQERPNWWRFAGRRIRAIVLPLVVWTIIYWVLREYIRHDPRMLQEGYWSHWQNRITDLLFGKAEFHLYFLSVLAQVCLVLPFFYLLFKRVRMGIWAVALIAVLLQACAFVVQKVAVFQYGMATVPPFSYPGSTVFWYLATIVPGIWVGMNWDEWPRIRSGTWLLWGFFALAGFLVFGYFAWKDLVGIPLTGSDGTLQNAGSSSYMLGMPFLVLAFLTIWGAHRASAAEEPDDKAKIGPGTLTWRSFRALGLMSMQIYLMHPILLQYLTKPSIMRVFRSLPVPSLWYFLVTLLGTFAVGLVMDKVPFMNQIFFGKEFLRKKKPAEKVTPA
jgi:peptidoglycan/LPS O-acetylase OafA/YrhL